MITPVLLCGGSGTRLWPLVAQKLSQAVRRADRASESLFQASARRLSGAGFAAPVVITGAGFPLHRHRTACRGRASTRGAVLIEPAGRNTAPADSGGGAACWPRPIPTALMLVAPSDHVIPDAAAFRAAVAAGVPARRGGRLVTFGIAPDRPGNRLWLSGTGRGAADGSRGAQPLHALRRKTRCRPRPRPCWPTGSYLWNAGIFLFTATHRSWPPSRAHAPAI